MLGKRHGNVAGDAAFIERVEVSFRLQPRLAGDALAYPVLVGALADLNTGSGGLLREPASGGWQAWPVQPVRAAAS
jgi:hypothetical protein